MCGMMLNRIDQGLNGSTMRADSGQSGQQDRVAGIVADSTQLPHEIWYPGDARNNALFWERLGGAPDLRGKTILEIGCGRGRLTTDMARAGASRVDAVDTDDWLIDFAQCKLHRHYPELSSVINFVVGDVSNLPTGFYDLVVSKDTFEHVLDLPTLLASIRRCLKLAGHLYAGFGPLYNSPTGDHGVALSRIPWGHLLTPMRVILRRVNQHRTTRVSSLLDLHAVNMLAYRDYCRLFRESGLRQVYWRINQSRHLASRVLTLLRRIPFLTEYCTHNIYCVMERVE